MSKSGRQKSAKPVDEYVGLRIRERRRAMGMSQEALARRIGLTFQQVQKYESARTRVGASRLQQVADALETTPAWFFPERSGVMQDGPDRGDARTEDDDITAFMADPLAASFMRSFVKLGPYLRQAVVRLVRAAAAKE
jgi:transcriptional regulator with XRE-family HTH domain